MVDLNWNYVFKTEKMGSECSYQVKYLNFFGYKNGTNEEKLVDEIFVFEKSIVPNSITNLIDIDFEKSTPHSCIPRSDYFNRFN